MKKTTRFLSMIIAAISLSACALSYQSAWRNEGKGIVAMYSLYEEVAIVDGVIGGKFIESRKNYTSAVFKNKETGEERIVGVLQGYKGHITQYMLTGIAPGYYELVSWRIGDTEAEYDSVKCGKIGFDITERDILVFKGLKPLSIGDNKTIFGTSRKLNYAAFSTLPEDYTNYITENFNEVMPTRNIKVVDLASDDSVAFERCIAESDNKYQTLGEGEGATQRIAPNSEEYSTHKEDYQPK